MSSECGLTNSAQSTGTLRNECSRSTTTQANATDAEGSRKASLDADLARIHAAIRTNSAAEVCDALYAFYMHGGDSNTRPAEWDNCTLLHVAACEGLVEAMFILLDVGGANVNMVSGPGGGETALQAACRKGHWRAAKLLLMYHADVTNNRADDTNNRAAETIGLAARGGDAAAADVLALCTPGADSVDGLSEDKRGSLEELVSCGHPRGPTARALYATEDHDAAKTLLAKLDGRVTTSQLLDRASSKVMFTSLQLDAVEALVKADNRHVLMALVTAAAVAGNFSAVLQLLGFEVVASKLARELINKCDCGEVTVPRAFDTTLCVFFLGSPDRVLDYLRHMYPPPPPPQPQSEADVGNNARHFTSRDYEAVAGNYLAMYARQWQSNFQVVPENDSVARAVADLRLLLRHRVKPVVGYWTKRLAPFARADIVGHVDALNVTDGVKQRILEFSSASDTPHAESTS